MINNKEKISSIKSLLIVGTVLGCSIVYASSYGYVVTQSVPCTTGYKEPGKTDDFCSVNGYPGTIMPGSELGKQICVFGSPGAFYCIKDGEVICSYACKLTAPLPPEPAIQTNSLSVTRYKASDTPNGNIVPLDEIP